MAMNPKELVEQWLASKSPSARRTYVGALRRFAIWATSDPSADQEHSVPLLVNANEEAARILVSRWRDAQLAAGLSTGTVAGRIAAISSLVRCCRRAGLVSWVLEGIAPKVNPTVVRPIPCADIVEQLVEFVDAAAATGDRQAVRDAAVIRLLFCSGLRRSEAAQLRLEDVDLAGGTVAPRLMGKRERSRVSITRKTARSLRRWLALRGDAPGWLFFRTDRDDPSKPISGESVRRLLREWPKAAGIRGTIRPEGLKLSAESEARMMAKQFLAEVGDI